MKPQYHHKVMTSFLLWFDNYLLQKGEAYSNKTGVYHYMEDTRLPSDYIRFSTPYKQFVTDSSITGSPNPIIPSTIELLDLRDNVVAGTLERIDGDFLFDFENGGIIRFGTALNNVMNEDPNSAYITGSFAVKDFNIYLTNETEEDLILESKFINNSRYGGSAGTGIKPYDQAVPAIFINSETIQNVPFAFGGEDETRMGIKAVVLAEDNYNLDAVLSIFADSRNKDITLIPFSGHPATEYGDIDGGSYNYTGLVDTYKTIEEPLYIEDVVVSKLSDKAQKQSIGDLKVGFIDFDVYQRRFPRQ